MSGCITFHPLLLVLHCSKVDFASADPQLFDRMFSTFKILKQSPAYTDAMKSDSGLDMTNTATVRFWQG
jgi:hypothetical protein